MKANINELFDNLDKWRHFPAYQLERRADVFFAIYLPQYLIAEKKVEIQAIITEFPIRVGTIHSKTDTNQSFKIDYLIKLRNPRRVLFVELKTDLSSRRPKQDHYLIAPQKAGMRSLLRGLQRIYRITTSKGKYKCLLQELEHANLICHLHDKTFDIVDEENRISILYLQPKGRGRDKITFNQLANFVDRKRDDLSKRFSMSLREWASIPAGAKGCPQHKPNTRFNSHDANYSLELKDLR